MKRFLALFLTIVMLATMLASCNLLSIFGQQETTTQSTPQTTPVSKTAIEVVEGLNPAQLFDSTFDCKEAIFNNVESIDSILNAFTDAGFTKLDVGMVEGATFETILLTGNDDLVTVYWIASQKEVRIMCEKADQNALSVLQKNDFTDGGTLTIVQIGVERVSETDNPNIGLCYVIKLSNGNAIVIDGGFGNDLCAENIYKTLEKLDIAKNEKGKYMIEAWILTHGHGDHCGVIYSFAQFYAMAVEVSYFVYQLPNNTAISVDVGKTCAAGEEDLHKTIKATFPGATIITPHVGLNYYFGNATISMLYTPDTLWNTEKPIDYYNDNSLIFKVSGGKTAFLCMGDAGENAAKVSWNLFDDSVYESGLLQITHHGMTTGANGGTDWDYIGKIYRATGATTVALPLGTTYAQGGRNGRYSIIFQNGYRDQQMSYIVNKGNGGFSGGYFNASVWDCFIYDVENGTNTLKQQYGLTDKTLYGHDGINMIDNDNGIITYISCSDKTEMATVFQFAKGAVTVKKNQTLDDWLKKPDFTVAEVIASIDKNAQIFESTFDAKEVVLKNITEKQSIVSLFTNRGFEVVSTTQTQGAKFETMLFTNGAELATLYWKPLENEARIVVEKLDENTLPYLVSNASTGKGELTVVKLENGYVIRLSNGNAIVIDGGANTAKNAETIYNTLSKLNVARNEYDQYVIEAWIFTNDQRDYNGVLDAFSEAYSEKVELFNFLYQLPTNSAISATNERAAALAELCKAVYPNTTVINPKAGLDYYFGNATISMLYTPDLAWSTENKIADATNTALIYKLSGGGVSAIGKNGGAVSLAILQSNYDSNALNCNELNSQATAVSFENGTITVVTDATLSGWLDTVTLVDSFVSTFDSNMEIYTNVKNVSLFVNSYVASGYKRLEIDTIEGARFETIMLQKGTSLITMYWFPATGDLRIAYDTIPESALAPLTPNAETGKGEILVAQIGVDIPDPENLNSTENNPNIGLCYVFKLSNGRAMIIDGGWNYDSNAHNLYKTLKTMGIATNAQGQFIIEAWFFTHGHGDHNGIVSSFTRLYPNAAEVNYFVYQLPLNTEITAKGGGIGEENFHELCKTAYPTSTYLNPRSGVTYFFGNAQVDMLHTPDIIWSHATPIPDYNDSGIIFKTYGGGVEGYLCMGDSCEHPATAAVKNYEVSAFNANIVQIAHHGLNTQINEGHEWKNMKVIYEGATVEYAFLPMGIAKPNIRSGRWSVLCGWGYNGKQASFVINREDDAAGVNQEAWGNFVSGILDGTIKDKTFLGYNGYNMIDNGKGMITYIHCSETAPMVTIMSFKDGKVTVQLNQELNVWFIANR